MALPKSFRIKICGITNLQDALMAVELGADTLGFVFFPQSPRYIKPDKAKKIIARLPSSISKVGVFVDEKPERVKLIAKKCGLDTLQFHGQETNRYCQGFSAYKIIKAFRIKNSDSLKDIEHYEVDGFLLDTFVPKTYGGTGRSFNWDLLKEIKRWRGSIILSGGLNPNNITTAIKRIRPWAVDISSGVEEYPGKKSPRLLKQLFKNIGEANG